MTRPPPALPPLRAAVGEADTLLLLGLPPLAQTVGDLEQALAGHRDVDTLAVIDAWHAAHRRYETLQREQGGVADAPAIGALPPEMDEWARALVGLPAYERDFASVAVAFGLVPLEALVVRQRRVVLDHVIRVAQRLGTAPSSGTLVQECLPRDGLPTELSLVRSDDDTFVFASPSMDLRAFDPRVLRLDLVPGFQGTPGKALALPVGFGSNCLNVIRHGGRLVLSNGYHRALALLSAGIAHAPALIQAPAGAEELALIGRADLLDDPELYFERPRPPLLGDFLDPALAMQVSLPRVRRQIQVTIRVRTLQTPA